MALSKTESDQIIRFVKREPCLIQDLAQHIDRSWITTESYVEKISQDTGLIRTKTFRKGTKGATKIVFWNYTESLQTDEVKAKLFEKIKLFKNKEEFDPTEIFQFVSPTHAKAFIEPYHDSKTQQKLIAFFEKVENELLSFSGNISWMRHEKIIKALDQLLDRGVRLKIVGRIDLETLENLKKVDSILKKHGSRIEIRHCLHPVRGLVADQKMVRLKQDKIKAQFREQELPEDFRVFYEIDDPEWVAWFSKTFWYLFRTSISLEDRIRVLETINREG